MYTEDFVSFELAKLLKDKGFDESRSDDEMVSIIQQLIITARDAHSNPSLAKQYQDALEWFNKIVGYDRCKDTRK